MQIIKDIFSTINKVLKISLTFIVNLPGLIVKYKNHAVIYFKKLRYNLNNLTESNLDLGIYHLKNRNFNDAIFRFKFIDKYLDKGNLKANYWLGWTYFMKNKYPEAIECLQKAKTEDKVDLKSFIMQIDNIQHVPDDIYIQQRSINTDIFIDKFLSDTENLPQTIIEELLKAIENLPDKYSILDLGSNIALLGNEAVKRMPDTFELIGVEAASEMTELHNIYFPNLEIYNKIYTKLPIKYLEETEKKYDVIISLEGISYHANLQNTFDNIYKSLNDGGYFAISLKDSNSGIFSKNHIEFAYNEQQLVEWLSNSGFTIKCQKKIMLEIKNIYYIFVVSK